MVTVAAQQINHERPLYHPYDSPNHYSALYGPLVYEISAVGLKLISNPILAAKIPVALECLLFSGIIAWIFYRMGGIRATLAGLGFIALQLLWYAEPISFWVRPDALTILASALGLLSLFLKSRVLTLLALSTGIVLAFDSKLDSVIFLLPAVAVLVSRHGFGFIVWLAALAIPLSFLPFLVPNVTLHGFSLWAFSMVGSATVLPQALKNLFFFALMVAPVALFCRPELFRSAGKITEDGILLASALLAGVLIMYPAAKIGSGTHHYAPLSIWIGYLMVRSMVESKLDAKPNTYGTVASIGWGVGLMAWVAVVACVLIRSVSPIVSFLEEKEPGLAQADLLHMLSHYPTGDVQMGYAGESAYADSYQRPWIYRSGIPEVIDASAEMNMQIFGLNQNALEECLANEQYRYWILPKGTPFSLSSFYTHAPLFEGKVQRLFTDNYRKVESSAYYDMYQSRKTIHP